MKKRNCSRFNIPGTTLHYKEKSVFFFSGKYSIDYYPVINLSKGGASFLCDQRLRPGKFIFIKLNIPGIEAPQEILASVKWISKNPEQSYRYRTGIGFNPYGPRKNENPVEILSFLEGVEAGLSHEYGINLPYNGQ